MAASSDYRLGSIWLVTFDPSVGTEIRKTRPAVIISGTAFNQRSKVTVVPITSAVPVDVIVNRVLFEEEHTELVELAITPEDEDK